MDMESIVSSLSVLQSLLESDKTDKMDKSGRSDKKNLERLILINNAGVCLEGNTQDVLLESLTVNCLSPVSICELLISKFQARDDAGDDGKGGQLTIINVSSGEGELLFLHSDIQDKVAAIGNYEVR